MRRPRLRHRRRTEAGDHNTHQCAAHGLLPLLQALPAPLADAGLNLLLSHSCDWRPAPAAARSTQAAL
ncbi:hypothetical protein ASF90_16615 [Xanthomonas sp. Leaf148]|nr:hypothetical protein ASF90_16615 [Xanthomonas sp. Leaf148]